MFAKEKNMSTIFENVIIKRRGGETFKLIFTKSPFDVAGIKTKATTGDILNAVEESRAGIAEPTGQPDSKGRSRFAGC